MTNNLFVAPPSETRRAVALGIVPVWTNPLGWGYFIPEADIKPWRHIPASEVTETIKHHELRGEDASGLEPYANAGHLAEWRQRQQELRAR